MKKTLTKTGKFLKRHWKTIFVGIIFVIGIAFAIIALYGLVLLPINWVSA
ncbi:hypothetical protein [[Mycoplasma] gypis]|uniref:Uncharacterized protein n=1 Tax=[Mycoplasma] gypis TaxID=92404 RepID=A0ABZ2RMP6_9BACT|nr:hypothetical protein [[Mycoplasma] gypis]MBN0919035.1 hypothetical protein [[Mycoplasma] gypis]